VFGSGVDSDYPQRQSAKVNILKVDVLHYALQLNRLVEFHNGTGKIEISLFVS
jgi:hypothetical protein